MAKNYDEEEIDDEVFDDEEFDDSESLEKTFEEIFYSKNVVYFLEDNGSWWKNTCSNEEEAKRIVQAFKK